VQLAKGVAILVTLLPTCVPGIASAQQTDLTAEQVAERLNEWDQAYARLKREIWNLQRGSTMFGSDLRQRTMSDDLRDFALTKPTEKHVNELRTAITGQLAKGDTHAATVTFLELYRDLRAEMDGLGRIGEHHVRARQVARQRDLWQQLAATVNAYRTPDNIRNLEQQAIDPLTAGRFEQVDATYDALLLAYGSEREQLYKSNGYKAQYDLMPIVYERRSPCGEPVKNKTGKPMPSLASTTQPIYPTTARRANQEGVTYLQVLVGSSGCVLRYAIRFSSGWLDLDDAAIDWMESVQFVPAAAAGKAIDMWVVFPVSFHLTD
jgi:TonB family protein